MNWFDARAATPTGWWVETDFICSQYPENILELGSYGIGDIHDNLGTLIDIRIIKNDVKYDNL